MLLKYLLAAEQYRRRVEETIEEFWPNAPAHRGREYFRRGVMLLRQALEPARPSYVASSYLVTDRECITLRVGSHLSPASSGIWLDAHEFEQLANRVLAGLRRGELIREAADRAIDLYRGSFLAQDVDPEWAARARDHYQRLWAMLISSMARTETVARQFECAILLLGNLVRAFPDDENAVLRLMVMYAAMGNRGAAFANTSRFVAIQSGPLVRDRGPHARSCSMTFAKVERWASGSFEPREEVVVRRPAAVSVVCAESPFFDEQRHRRFATAGLSRG
jgi:DNA-binding SARP family transcriptional activator